jgi:hypothetical protein
VVQVVLSRVPGSRAGVRARVLQHACCMHVGGIDGEAPPPPTHTHTFLHLPIPLSPPIPRAHGVLISIDYLAHLPIFSSRLFAVHSIVAPIFSFHCHHVVLRRCRATPIQSHSWSRATAQRTPLGRLRPTPFSIPTWCGTTWCCTMRRAGTRPRQTKFSPRSRRSLATRAAQSL